MTITITYSTLLNDLLEKSHLEVASIPDPDARYRTEAGTEKLPEIRRCLDDGAMLLKGRCARFLLEDSSFTPDSSDNSLPTVVSYVYEFDLTSRRAAGKTEALKNTIENFIVHYALSKFYASVNQGEFSNKHSLLAVEASNNLDMLLFSKHPPRL